jgi:hypothetical protein
VHLTRDQHRRLAVYEELVIARLELVRLAVGHNARDRLGRQIENKAGGNKSEQSEPRETMRILAVHGSAGIGAVRTLMKCGRTEKQKKSAAGQKNGDSFKNARQILHRRLELLHPLPPISPAVYSHLSTARSTLFITAG